MLLYKTSENTGQKKIVEISFLRTLKINQRLLNGTLEKYFFNAKENNGETGKQLTLKTNTKMADVNPTLSVITLNANRLNTPSKVRN